jgi:hypothetical protein
MIMIIIENRDFIEGIFASRETAAEYMKNHPDTSNCRIFTLTTDEFPIYSAETERGKFSYFVDERAFVDFLRNLDLNDISKKKAYGFTISPDNQCEQFETDDELLTLYIFREPYQSFAVNEDGIGSCEHYHISTHDRERILKYNTITCLWESMEN